MVVNTIKEIKFVQVNLHHSIAATATLVQRAKDQCISIACVQEMHQVKSTLVGIPSKCKLFTTKRTSLKAGIICFNPDLPIMKVFSANNTVGATLPYRGKILLILTVYCPPKEELRHTLEELENSLLIPHDRVLITGDFNSKSPVWGSDIEDERGRQLMEFVLSKGLAIVNEEDTIPTFEGAQGRSWVDLTISDPELLENIFKWQVDIEPTNSDHNSIAFSLTSLQKEIGNRELGTFADLDEEVEDYVSKITAACTNSAKSQLASPKKQKWWDKSLEILRSQVRRAKRKMYQARLPEDRKYLRSRFKKIEGEFKFQLLKAKREGWSDTCEEVTTTQPFGVHFDIAKNPDRRHFQLSAVQRSDGSLTSTTEEALHVLLDFHFPTDNFQDSPAQATIRSHSKTPPLTQDDPPFSTSEIEAAVKNVRSKKAPGPDGLFGDIIKEAYKANPHYVSDLFNACLSKGHFPKKWKKADLVLFNK
ncbi:Retrovirus-related Pol polyprotein from type-1 retrotransposable element R1, partial [Araneus ventricosus]